MSVGQLSRLDGRERLRQQCRPEANGRPPGGTAVVSRITCSEVSHFDLEPFSPSAVEINQGAIVTEELLGPAAPIVTFATDDEAVSIANASEFGLAAYVMSGSLQRALRLAEALDAGMVGVNRGLVSDPAAPFGGVKQSGLGREGAREGLLEFTETQMGHCRPGARKNCTPHNRGHEEASSPHAVRLVPNSFAWLSGSGLSAESKWATSWTTVNQARVVTSLCAFTNEFRPWFGGPVRGS